MERKDSILEGVALKSSRVLEVGALHRPLVRRDEADVYYLDYCDTASLRAKYRSNPEVPAEAIVDVDIVMSAAGIYESALHRAPFDVIVASHVIEHVPDFVSWLRDLHRLLRADGVVCLAVPDKRVTFDILRRVSTMKDVDEAHAERRRRPSLDTVCDSYRNVVGLESSRVWDGTLNLDECPIGWPAETVRSVIDDYLAGNYVDVHCWVFTPWRFIDLLGGTLQKYEIPFDLLRFANTKRGDEEFHVQLKKQRSKSECSTDWDLCAALALGRAVHPTYVDRH
jgi:SAM-dependent methyltransferase